MHHAPRFARTTTAAAVSLLCALASLSAQAQQTNPDDRIEKVIVTAQQREQAALDVPASVTSVNQRAARA